MDCEQQARQPCAADLQPRKDSPEQQRAYRMEEKIHYAVSGGVAAECQPLDPCRHRGQTKISCEPDVAQVRRTGDEWILRHKDHVVPDKPASQ